MIKNNGIPSDLPKLIPSESHLCNIRNTLNIKTYSYRTIAFKYYFFPWTINQWNKLNLNIWTSSFNIFRANLIKIIQPLLNSIFGIFDPLGLKLITKLSSQLNEHRFNQKLNNCINLLCTCCLDVESTVHFFLHCNYCNSDRISLLNYLNSIDRTLVNVLLYGMVVLSLMLLIILP